MGSAELCIGSMNLSC